MNGVRALVVILTVLVAFAGSVHAGQCGYSYSQPVYRPAYYRQSYYYPQTYSYSYSYAAPVVAVKEYKDVVLVPLVQKVAVTPEYYYSVNQHYRDAILLELLQQQKALLQQAQTRPQVLPQVAPENGGNGHSYPPPTGKGPLPLQAPQASGRIGEIIQGACFRCHGGEQGTKGNLSLANLDQVPMRTRLLCYQQVKVGAMPQKANPLSDADCDEFLNWALAAPK